MPRLSIADIELTDRMLAIAEGNGNEKTSSLNSSLEKHQLTTDNALEVLSGIMHYSRRENNKIAVAKIALNLNGVMAENAEENSRAPNIQFVFNESDVNLNGIFCPKRS